MAMEHMMDLYCIKALNHLIKYYYSYQNLLARRMIYFGRYFVSDVATIIYFL